MRLAGWYVEGYGVFHKYEVRPLPPGLTVFLGPNEAGKSTLLSYLCGVLFGFARPRGQPMPYPPLHGGRHGGRVFLTTEAGEVVVSRYAARKSSVKVILPDGSKGAEEDLRRLLGYVDAKLFRSVFAFDLGELHALETLQKEGVKERIFSAGIAGAGGSARETLAKLKARREKLLRQRASALITDLLEELNATGAERARAADAALGYPALVQEEEARRRRVVELGAEKEALEAQVRRLGLLIELWPAWRELSDARAQHRALASIDTFPADPKERLATCTEALRNSRRALERLAGEARGLAAAREELSARIDDALPPLADDAAALIQGIDVYQDRCGRLSRAQVELEHFDQRIMAALAHLGEGWNAERIRAVDVSIPAQEKVGGHEDAIASAAAALQEARRNHDRAAKERARLSEERARVEARLAEYPPEPAEQLEAREKAMRRIRAHLSELKAHQVRVEAKADLVREVTRALDAASSGRKPIPALWRIAVLGVLVALLAGAAVWVAAVWHRHLEGAIIGTFGLITAGFAFFFRQMRRDAIAEEERRSAITSRLDAELEAAEASGQVAQGKVDQLHAKVVQDAQVLGAGADVSFAEVEEIDAGLARLRDRARQWEADRARLDELAAQCRALEAEEAACAEAAARAEAALRAAQELWERWKAEAGLPATLSPRGAVDFMAEVRAARELLRARNEVKEGYLRTEEEAAAWETAVRGLLARAAAPDAAAATAERLIPVLKKLRARCEADREARARRAEIQEREAQLADQARIEEDECAKARDAQAALFAEAGAVDEPDFLARLDVYEQRRRLTAVIADREHRIDDRIGKGEEAAALRAALAAGELEKWREELRGAEARLPRMEGERDAALAGVRDAESARLALEASADTAALDTRLGGIRNDLADAVREWRIASMAQGLIEETLREYTRTRQPEVIADASDRFRKITHGTYERVVQSEDHEELIITDRDGRTKRPETLSRGTAEQLYLCLRLGLIAAFSRRHGPLPLIMDDVLVNFDIERARAFAEVLSDFARDHQVLLFTCHPETAGLLRDAAPGTRVFRMERFGGAAGAVQPVADEVETA